MKRSAVGAGQSASPRGRAGLLAVAAGLALATGGTALAVTAHSATVAAVGTIPASDIGRLPLPGRLAGPAPVDVRIPTIGVDAPVTVARLQRGALVAPSDPRLVGWWDASSPPGSAGPAVLVGHVDGPHARAVFFGLHSLRPGASVFVRRANGTTVRFTVDAIRQYPSNHLPRTILFGSTARPTLRLITCGDYRWISGHYQADVVVFAHAAATSWSV